MASMLLRALLTIAVVGLLVGLDDAFWLRRGSRRSRPRPRPPPRCPDPADVLPGAQTTWDGTFTFLCPDFQVIRRIRSAYCDAAKDRVWRFDCESIPGVSVFHELFWSGWINDYDRVMNYQCPFNAIITGFKSEHNNGREDRRWNMFQGLRHDHV
ncbi:Hypp1818 [Branchiostoma lanceolatum]|uniref:Hypp1818 protein n=1 Tax=Branchiostoma lanceolatum TaxID=7740 RepID=A0A8J9ZMA6_BRALA|nr:Hypp1818 [Branchiostoma lanceolatum]